jgi:hemolysin III
MVQVSSRAVESAYLGEVAPRFRGVVHKGAFFITVPLGLALASAASAPLARVAAIAFATSVSAMFGASSLFHRVRWTPAAKSRMALIDHAMIHALIAGTYTPFALLSLRTSWRIPALVTVWGAALAAIVGKLVWRNSSPRVAAATCIGLGWVAVLLLPQIVGRVGIAGATLLVAGGLVYTAGAIVYARRRPDPFPETFGYHEVFHVLVVLAVMCQYAAVAFVVLAKA